MSENGPAWFYRTDKSGGFEAKLFADGVCPKGWVDSPAKVGPKKQALQEDGGGNEGESLAGGNEGNGEGE